MRAWTFDKEELERTASCVMSATLNALQAEGKLTQEDAKRFEQTHTVVILTPNSVATWIKKALFGDEKDAVQFRVVKVL